MSFLTCRCDLPQKEQSSCSFESVGRAIAFPQSRRTRHRHTVAVTALIGHPYYRGGGRGGDSRHALGLFRSLASNPSDESTEANEPLGRFVYGVARDPADGVARGLPGSLLARVLGGDLVELRSVDLDDQASRGPREVRLLAGEPLVDRGRFEPGVVEDFECLGLGVGAAAAVREAGVAVVEVLQAVGASAAAVLLQAYGERVGSD